ncbi:MAG: ferrous iron transport protein [Bacteroidetes bacterium]|nr:ferrous iron transport protein [Bacteroidota bacterium]
MEPIQSLVNFSEKNTIKIALVGNPNSGKSTLFNALTGMNQRTGNFPGVTVDKKVGTARLSDSVIANFIDLPGTYSLYPKSLDERVAFDVLCNEDNEEHPDLVIIVADASNLKRNLFLVSQIIDLKIPVILALNMMDMVEKDGDTIDLVRLSERLGVKVVGLSARNKIGIEELKQALLQPLPIPAYDFIDIKKIAPEIIERVKTVVKVKSDFMAFQMANNLEDMNADIRNRQSQKIADALNTLIVDKNKLQALESVERYKMINRIVEECITRKTAVQSRSFTQKLDGILTHRVWGYAIFLAILFLIFQTIFFLAAFPMEWIETMFVTLSDWATKALPQGELTSLLVNGILAGLSGVVVFVPQIALLFAFIAILEDTGYMARVSFIMDKLLRKFGLNGRSVIPLMSGVACAVPAIMSARTISNWKERIITIMVTPLMSCSARLPVYTLLISLVIPKDKHLGFFNYQGLILMALYLVGFLAAIGAAIVMKWILKAREKSYFIMELPVYRSPQWRTVGLTIFDKVKMFLWDAGKIIVAISIILWFLSSHAPGNRFETIEKKYEEPAYVESLSSKTPGQVNAQIASEKLEASYAGILGKAIEPAIAPLGFDWKIGIALVTSFAAREVFVGTMATIYSVGDADNTQSIQDKMRAEINPGTGLPKFSMAVGFSLLIFYAFAMQCMSTLAIVYRETKKIKWPLIQFFYMSALAYLASLLVYNLLK